MRTLFRWTRTVYPVETMWRGPGNLLIFKSRYVGGGGAWKWSIYLAGAGKGGCALPIGGSDKGLHDAQQQAETWLKESEATA